MMRRGAMVLAVLLLAALPAVVSAEPASPPWRMQPPFSTEIAVLDIGGVQVKAEIADTFETRARGLGNRDGLRPGWGMLFISSTPSVQSFWMKDMRFCLDIIWIERGVITGAAENFCPQPGALDSDLKVVSSDIPVTYVLEMPAGWLKKNGFRSGTPVVMNLPRSA